VKRFVAFAAVVAFLAIGSLACADTTSWDYASNFLAPSPDGSYSEAGWSPWSTGYISGGSFHSHNYFAHPDFASVGVWSDNRQYDAYGHTWKNTSSSPVTQSLGPCFAQLDPGKAGVMTGNTSGNAAIQWTAPAEGWYAVSALFTGASNWVETAHITNVSVSKGSTSLFAGMVDGYIGSAAAGYTDGFDGDTGTRSASYSGTSYLAMGDVLAFEVANGHNPFNLCWVGTALSVTTTTPEPSSIVLVASALVGLLAYAWRKRK